MIDHVLGRPSVQFRKIQVLTVVSFWSLYLLRGNKNGPPGIRRISSRLSKRLTPWQTLVITMLWLYLARNFGKLVGLECPEPLANLYTSSYFRATWVTTALDAGFWTAMRIRRKWIRDLASMVFSIYYLIAAEQADEKVRKIRGVLTVDHLRVSWNKATTPYLSFFTKLLRPRLMRYPPRAIRIPRPPQSSYTEPVAAWLYFDGPLSALKDHTKVVLDIPGGGFVAMTPRNHDERLLAWAGRTGLPVLSLNYRKAPEFPYPYALDECYDVYRTIIASRGRCVGLSGETCPQVVISGDSAGGNLATGVVLMIVQSGANDSRSWENRDVLPVPEALVLMYPALDMNIGNWMTDEQMAYIKDRRMRKTNKAIISRKSEDYSRLTPGTPHPSGEDIESSPISSPPQKPQEPSDAAPLPDIDPAAAHITPRGSLAAQTESLVSSKPQPLKTRLATSSMISYFADRVLTPEMMRAMIILYIGPHTRPDFSTDYLLSPLVAPESLLAKFPKTYFLTGERDPLVDDTAIFAGRLRTAQWNAQRERQQLGLLSARALAGFREQDFVEVCLIPGISHGFLQFLGVFPEGWRYVYRTARWIDEAFAQADQRLERDRRKAVEEEAVQGEDGGASAGGRFRHRRKATESSGDEDRPLEMSMLNGTRGRGAAARRRRRAARTSTADSEAVIVDEDEGEGGKKDRERSMSPLERTKSMVSSASEDDLLGRRMKGLTSGLLGEGDEDLALGRPEL